MFMPTRKQSVKYNQNQTLASKLILWTNFLHVEKNNSKKNNV